MSSWLYGFMSAIGIARVGHHNHARRHTPTRECARTRARSDSGAARSRWTDGLLNLYSFIKRCCSSNPLYGGSAVALRLRFVHAATWFRNTLAVP